MLASLLLLAACAPAWGQSNKRQAGEIAVIVSHDTPPYRDALGGLRQALQDADVTLRTTQLPESGALPANVEPRLETRLTIALGARASDALSQASTTDKVLPCMMLDAGNRRGMLLTYPPSSRLALVREILPAARILGAIYTGKEPSAEIRSLEQAARRQGLRLVAIRIDPDTDLHRQLDARENDIDALLATFDSTSFFTRNAQTFLLFSYRHRIPLIGLSDAWTRAGALLSTDWDYTDLGRQCGEAALSMLRSGAPLQQNVVPRRVMYSINSSAARYFHLAPTEELVRDARHIFD